MPPGVVQSVSTMQSSLYGLVAWVVIMTLALAALSVVIYRRWRRSVTLMDDGGESVSSGGDSLAGGDLADVYGGGGPVTAVNITPRPAACDGETNATYQHDDAVTIDVPDSAPDADAATTLTKL